MESYVLVLASGGIDSTACINFYKNLNFNVEALFIDYGQKAAKQELKAVKLVSEIYKVNLKVLEIKGDNMLEEGEVLGRNAFFIFIGLLNFKREKGIISLGIHQGTSYYDCSKTFFEQSQVIVDNYSQGMIKLCCPFLDFNKKEIYDYALHEKLPLNICYSCELGNENPCGRCSTCKDLEIIYASTSK